MDSAWLQVLLSAVSAGGTCSVCGASGGSAFLSSYVITHRRLAFPLMSFLAGKVIMTAALCTLSALLGQCILGDNSKGLWLLTQLIVLVTAFVLIGRWVYIKRKPTEGCPHAGHCNSPIREPSGALALLASGIACGATPCQPLLLVLSASAVLPPALAAAAGCVFAVTGVVSPVLFWLAVSRLLAGKFRRDMARYADWFQLGCYVLLCAVTVYTLFRYI